MSSYHTVLFVHRAFCHKYRFAINLDPGVMVEPTGYISAPTPVMLARKAANEIQLS